MALSIDESIRIFKAEIIAQDQQLPQRRAEPLLDACACLKLRFNSRKNTLAILGMAEGVTRYMLKRQATADPDCLDFLKEALAHVVNMYEDAKFNPEREEELGQRMYRRFTNLKATLKSRRSPTGPTAHPTAKPPGSAAAAEEFAAVAQPRLSSDQDQTNASEPAESSAPNQTSPPPPAAPGTTSSQHGPLEPAAKPATPEPVSEPALRPRTTAAVHPRNYTPQQGEEMLLVRIGNFPLLVARSAIALQEKLKPRARSAYLASSQVALRDFSPLLGRLAGRFQGGLSQIPGSRLKKMHLPLVIPKGGGLPLLPDDQAQHLLVLSHGQWHGIIFGTLEDSLLLPLEHFQAAANGDIAGLGTTGDASYPLLNPRSLLEREGFLTV